jgi:hypothetical protein
MLQQTVTHYHPWDTSDTFAACGARLTDTDGHATQPTCPACAAHLAAEAALEASIEDTPFPLDADEAAIVLDPVLNAGVPVRAPLSPFGAELFALARTLTYLERARLLDCPACDGEGHYTVTTRQARSGEREVGCAQCEGTGVLDEAVAS